MTKRRWIRSLPEKMAVLTEKSSADDACWLWTGAKFATGYGKVWDGTKGKHRGAHQAAWELAFGPVPAGLCVLHRCDVKACVNPDHLFLGTQANNLADMRAKGRHTRKLTAGQVDAIRVLCGRIGLSQKEVAARYGISANTISMIMTGRNWRVM